MIQKSVHYTHCTKTDTQIQIHSLHIRKYTKTNNKSSYKELAKADNAQSESHSHLLYILLPFTLYTLHKYIYTYRYTYTYTLYTLHKFTYTNSQIQTMLGLTRSSQETTTHDPIVVLLLSYFSQCTRCTKEYKHANKEQTRTNTHIYVT